MQQTNACHSNTNSICFLLFVTAVLGCTGPISFLVTTKSSPSPWWWRAARVSGSPGWCRAARARWGRSTSRRCSYCSAPSPSLRGARRALGGGGRGALGGAWGHKTGLGVALCLNLLNGFMFFFEQLASN